jgi:glycosyltransferase involved in cell wall biosynthesis
LLAYTDSPEVGGAELALGYLLGALSREIDVGVLATDSSVASAIVASRAGAVAMTVRSPRGLGDWSALREHLSAVRAFAPDIVHANQAWPWACGYGELAGLLRRGTRVLAVDHLPLAVGVPRIRKVGRRLLMRSVSAHVAVGDRCARMVEEIVGLSRGSVLAVPNGVPPCALASAPRTHSAGIVIGSLGRLTVQKDYELLVRALPTVPSGLSSSEWRVS